MLYLWGYSGFQDNTTLHCNTTITECVIRRHFVSWLFVRLNRASGSYEAQKTCAICCVNFSCIRCFFPLIEKRGSYPASSPQMWHSLTQGCFKVWNFINHVKAVISNYVAVINESDETNLKGHLNLMSCWFLGHWISFVVYVLLFSV